MRSRERNAAWRGSAWLRGIASVVAGAVVVLGWPTFAVSQGDPTPPSRPLGHLPARPPIATTSDGRQARLPPGAEELASERTETTRTWELDNGERLTRSYAAPVNFEREGRLVPIDAALVASSAAGVAFRTKRNAVTAELPKDTSDPVRVRSRGLSHATLVMAGTSAAVALTAVPAGLLATTPAAGAAPRCAVTHGRVALATAEARVFLRRNRHDGDDVYACLVGRRPLLVGERTAERAAAKFQLAGPFLAYRIASGSSRGVGYGVEIVDLRRRAVVAAAPAARGETFVLGRAGVALLAGPDPAGSGQTVVRALDAGARTIDESVRTLATGAIPAGSLAVSHDGRTGAWTENGAPRSVALR